MLDRGRLMRMVWAILAIASAWAGPARADYRLVVDPTDHRGRWEGWGGSLSWWANGVGRSSYETLYADLLFTTKRVVVNGTSLPGLGLNIARYNIGGGGLPSDAIDGAIDRRPATMPWYKDIDGFWKDWHSPLPTSSSWDWSRDANQRSVLATVQRRGATIEFHSNAPMWWMTEEKSSAGGALQAWNVRDYARYLATVVHRARNQWRIGVRSLSPFNEPSAGWWRYADRIGQEGVNLGLAQQRDLLVAIRQELDRRRLFDVVIAASDENSIAQATTTHEYFKNEQVDFNGRRIPAANLIGKVNVHGYNGLEPWRDDAARQRLRATVGDGRIWVSEYGDGEGGGMTLAQSILADLNHLRPTAWIYWQPVEPFSAWGFLNGAYSDAADQTSITRAMPTWVYRKYFVFAQFTRFLRPGHDIVGSNDNNSVISYNSATKRLVLVTANYRTAQRITYDLGGIEAITGRRVAVTYTNTENGRAFATFSVPLAGRTFSIDAMANTVYSLTIEGVTL